MTSYNVVIEPAARRQLKQFKRSDPQLLRHFISLIDGLSRLPYQGKPLTGNKKGCYSLRYDDYRIIYIIYEPEKCVQVVRVGHRREVYR